jgi:putative transposase
VLIKVLEQNKILVLCGMTNERKNIRLSSWDYSFEGVYFTTICCKDRHSFFGEIKDNKMILSEIGLIVSKYWLEIPDHFSHVKLDEFVVMPNHVHGIAQPARQESGQQINRFSRPVRNSVSVIIKQFKSSVKRWCNKYGFNNFQWQSRFYDQILYNENSIDIIRGYIHNNPINWLIDDLYN